LRVGSTLLFGPIRPAKGGFQAHFEADFLATLAASQGFTLVRPARLFNPVLRLRFQAPQIVEAIVDGRHPEALTAISLTRRIDLPALWSAQEQALGSR